MAKKSAEFPEQLIVRRKENTETYGNLLLTDLYERAKALSRKSKQASCYVWMKELDITYGVAVFLMDRMESQGLVKPAGESESGPRKFSSHE